MKKISLSVMAMLFACATVFASVKVPAAKSAKHSICTNCTKQKCVSGKCAKANCPKGTTCICK